MNKVIQYLPSNIPRILINRNIVQMPKTNAAPTTTTACSNEEEFVRDGYDFDAYLLGNCDDIINALSQRMDILKKQKHDKENQHHEPSPSSPITKISNNNYLSGKIVTNQDIVNMQQNKNNNINESILQRTLLFKGADVNELLLMDDNNIYDATTKTLTATKEIVLCDNCNMQINTYAMKCNVCFDYDLCYNCYNSSNCVKEHYNGSHAFIKESL